jgi:hypothetical protein
MLASLSEQVAGWPVPLFAGVLFYVLWVPIVLIAAAFTWTRNRLGWIPLISAEPGDWKRAVIVLLLLGLPVALGFGVLFALRSLAVLVGVVAAVAIVLVGILLPRLNRW